MLCYIMLRFLCLDTRQQRVSERTQKCTQASMMLSLKQLERTNDCYRDENEKNRKCFGFSLPAHACMQSSLARRLKDLEEVLKDRVEAKNERIVELNKQVFVIIVSFSIRGIECCPLQPCIERGNRDWVYEIAKIQYARCLVCVGRMSP
jgi:hypothetical protein